MTDSLASSIQVPDLEYSIKTREVALDKELLQLVQGACKADNLQRALDVTRLMHNPATVDAAAKVAAFYHLPGLQERMQEVKLDIELKRYAVEKKARREVYANGNGVSNGTKNGASKQGFSDFAPKVSKRNFGGVPAGTASSSYRDVTPLASGRSETFIPETPESELRAFEIPASEERSASPESKRKRIVESPDEFVVPKKRDEIATGGQLAGMC